MTTPLITTSIEISRADPPLSSVTKRERAVPHLLQVFAVVVLSVVVLIGSFATAMVKHDHNENTYVTQAVLLLKGKTLYRDFAYIQTPVLPHVYAALFRFTGTTHYLLTAKLATWAFWLAGIVTLFLTLKSVTGEFWPTFLFSICFAVNGHIVLILHECANYVLAMTLSLTSYLLLFIARRHELQAAAWLLAASGLMAGLAVSTKLYYLSIIPPVLVASCFSRSRNNRINGFPRGLLPCAVGCGVGLSPCAYYLFQYPTAFVYDNYFFHRITTQAYALAGYGSGMTLIGKFLYFIANVLLPTSNIALVCVAVFALTRLSMSKAPENRVRRVLCFEFLVPLAMLLCSLSAAVYMSPAYQQYFAMPIPFAFLAVGALWRRLGRVHQEMLLWFVGVAICVSLYPTEFHKSVRDAVNTDNWSAIQFHREAESIHKLLVSYGITGPVATMHPLRVLDAGIPIYDEFATGPFLFPVGDFFTPEQRTAMVTTSPQTLSQLFEQRPPGAILIVNAWKFYREDVLRKYAEEHGFIAIRSRQRTTLYINPRAMRHQATRRGTRRQEAPWLSQPSERSGGDGP